MGMFCMMGVIYRSRGRTIEGVLGWAHVGILVRRQAPRDQVLDDLLQHGREPGQLPRLLVLTGWPVLQKRMLNATGESVGPAHGQECLLQGDADYLSFYIPPCCMSLHSCMSCATEEER